MEDISADKVLPTSYITPTVHTKFPTEKLSLVDHSIEKIEPCIIYPESTDLNDKGAIDFIIHPAALHYIDLGSLQLEVDLSLHLPNNDVPNDEAQVYFTNNLLSSLFPIRKCWFNNMCTETMYSGNHIGRIKQLLNTNNTISDNRGETRGLFAIDAAKMASPITADIGDLNVARKTFSKKTNIHLKGYIDLDISTVNMWMVDLVTFRLSLEAANDKLIINSDAANVAYKTKINSIKLHVNRIKPTTGGFINTSKLLVKKPLEYLFTRHVIHNELLAAGQNSIIINRPFNSRIPSKIIIFMVKAAADQGSYTEDPHFYQHNGLENYRLMLDGKLLISQDVDVNNGATAAYVNSLETQNNSENFIPYNCYTKGCFLLAIKTNHSQSNELSFEQKGNLSIHLKFSSAMTANQKIYVMGICHSTFEISADRNCVTNYAY